MATNWQIAAIEDAARRFPALGISKDDRDIWISMRDEAVARLPVGEAAPEGWIKINVLGTLQVPKQPLIDAYAAMDDENFKYSHNGIYCHHIDKRRFAHERIIELGAPEFLQSGNAFPPEVEHFMMTLSVREFVDEDTLDDFGGGVPASSDFADAREEAQECGENPDDWVSEIMKVAEDNIRASLRSIIIFDEDMRGEDLEIVLIDYRGAA